MKSKTHPLQKLGKHLGQLGLTLHSSGGTRGKLQILIYHRVLSKADPLRPWEITRMDFESQMKLLAQHYKVLPLENALFLLKKGKIPPKSVCITFDDGYQDNIENALPILKRYNFSATFFIATGFLHGSMMFNDKIIEAMRVYTPPSLDLTEMGLKIYPTVTLVEKNEACLHILNKVKYFPSTIQENVIEKLLSVSEGTLPTDLMMSSQQVKSLQEEGMTIGCHTETHPILTKVTDHIAQQEIANSRDYLQDLLGTPILYFAYPNGQPERDYTQEHVLLVKKLGFEAAFSTWWGAATQQSDFYQLPRFTPWDKTPSRFLFRLMSYRHNTRGAPVACSV